MITVVVERNRIFWLVKSSKEEANVVLMTLAVCTEPLREPIREPMREPNRETFSLRACPRLLDQAVPAVWHKNLIFYFKIIIFLTWTFYSRWALLRVYKRGFIREYDREDLTKSRTESKNKSKTKSMVESIIRNFGVLMSQTVALS